MPQRTSTKAIVGFVLALIPCLLGAIPGLVLCILARGDIKRSNGALGGGGLALAGIILGGFWMFFGTIGILAAIAIPNFIRFQARAKQVEAKSGLAEVEMNIKMYQRDHAGAMPTSFADLGSKPDARYYTFYLGDDVDAPGSGPLAVPPEARALVTGAEAIAVGNVDNDPYLDVWMIDSSGRPTHVLDDLSNGPPVEQSR